VVTLIERGRAGMARLQPLLEAPLSVEDAGTIDQVGQGPLVLEGVTFTYGVNGAGQDGAAAADTAQAPALSGVSVTLEPGQTLGLVGPTGSGKSTLLRVLLRQATPQQGQVRWAGQPLDAYRLSALRSATSWVPQESFLFSSTIAENIALARPDATRAEIEGAARMAAIHDDILRFPYGYDTPVGEKGITLSGGQRQRVAIARALLAELRRARPERAAIIASHRLSAVVGADHIVVLRAGRVIEAGTHDELLLLDGWYASQWRYQQLEASLDAT
jgi:ATP-binding cassette subfamily B multidrug efflux pump